MSPEYENHAKTEASAQLPHKRVWCGQQYDASERCSNPAIFFRRGTVNAQRVTRSLVTFLGLRLNTSPQPTSLRAAAGFER